MKTTKKILSVVLALAMLVNVFVISTVALSPDTAVDLYVSCDKEVYSPGDEIVLTISEQVATSVGNMTLGGQYTLAYNSNYIKPYHATSQTLEDHGFAAIAEGYDASISTISFWENNSSQGEVISDELAAAGCTESIMYIVGSDGTAFDASSAKKDLFTIKMKIAENTPDGEYTIGFNPGSYEAWLGFVMDEANGGLYGPDDPTGYGIDAAAMFSYGKATFKVSSAAAVPSVVKSAGQIKMTATSATTVDPAFQLRIISKITAADWDANFANTAVDGATANYITKVGMVAYTGVAGDYNLDDAKAAIAAGASNGNYYYGETDYIKHADGGDATFGTILKCTHGSDKLQNDPICLGFVTYVDAAGQTQTIYYAETYTAPIVSNYDTLAQTYAQNYWGK